MQPGERVGSYVVEARLGAGQMGVVYAVRHAELGTRYALKVLRRELCSARDALRFQREVEHLAAVSSHPRVVPIHTAGEVKGALYYVMELVEGQTLQERLDRAGPMPPALAARYVRDLADALTALHRAGVVHRDLKPANVLLDARLDAARLADFGLARSFLDERNRLTVTGELVGTPHFMSPEQALGEPIGPPTDVYALGMVLFTLLAGRTAVSGKGLIDVLTRVGSGELERLPTLAPDTPEALVELIEACLQRDPARRPEARAIREALDAFVRAPARDDDEQPGRPRARLVPALTVVAVAAVGLAVVAVGRRPGAAGPPAEVAAVRTAPLAPPVGPTEPTAPPYTAPWLEEVAGGSLDELRRALEGLDRDGVARLSPGQRERLRRTLERLSDRWEAPFGGQVSTSVLRPDDVTAAGREIERLIVLHALRRRLDADHRLPDAHRDLFHPFFLPQLGGWPQRVHPHVLAELVALRPDDTNAYMLYADANRETFAEDARHVDVEVFRRGMQVARAQRIEIVWGRMLRALSSFLWSYGADPARAGPALDALRALCAEVEAVGWAPDDVAHAFAMLQVSLLPWHVESWPAIDPARRAEALAVARRAVRVAPDSPIAAGHLAGALIASGGDASDPLVVEARAEAERFFAANRRADTQDELLATRVAVAVCMVLERSGEEAAAADVCARALASCPNHPMLPVAIRRVLLLCRADAAPLDVRAALVEAERRLRRWTDQRARTNRDVAGCDELLARLAALAAGLGEGALSPAQVTDALTPLRPGGEDLLYAHPVPRAR